jgi:hypothetical protein
MLDNGPKMDRALERYLHYAALKPLRAGGKVIV